MDGISFEIPKGQVVGFLGPNGAGKTTTMRLLTGYLPPDQGRAKLMGRDIISESLEIRQNLGYLAENNPLPDDIEVTDFLHYTGRLRGFHESAERMARVKKVLKQCSLSEVVGRKIGELSKGFKQRVGLAQAIIHDPEVLIMDEPTSGLDPNQVREIRDLILNLKKEKTLLLSTHILSEVKNTCDRVLIINKGKIVADGNPGELGGSMQNVTRLVVSFKADWQEVERKLNELGGVRKVLRQRDTTDPFEKFIIESDSGVDLREGVFNLAVEKGWPIMGMHQERLSLEEVFQALTQDAE